MLTSWETDYVAGETQFRVCFNYSYTPGRPAFTPRGEYAPIDPPEPAEVEIGQIGIWEDAKWRHATKLEAAILTEWAEEHCLDDMIEEAEAKRHPDPDEAYELSQEEVA